jgi:hypothetical protein
MNLPSDTPRLPKWIFLTGDAALLATAWIIYDQSGRPFTGVPLVAFAACVIAAGVIGVIPFVSDYARRQDEALDDRQRSLQALSVTVAASAEQIAIAATGLQGIAEAAQENFAKLETLSKVIGENIAELKTVLERSRKDGGESAAKLESAAKAIAASVGGVESAVAKASVDSQGRSEALSKQILEKIAEVRALQAGARKDEGDAASKLEAVAKKLAAAVASLEASADAPAKAATPVVIEHVPVLTTEVPPVLPSRIVEIKPAVASSFSPFDEAAAPAAPAAPASEAQAAPAAAPAPAPRKRGPRKAPAAPTPAPAPAPAEEAKPAEPESQLSPPEVAEPAVSTDGSTRLMVTAYIGIGNRLFIRGDGPGLSWEKGVPLSFVSIGKWRWETAEATKPIKFKLYKNDEAECSALGELSVEPGAQQDLTAVF